MKRGIAAAILMCAVMALSAAVPLALADIHPVLKGEKGPNASAQTWEYVPDFMGIWTGHIVNTGLRSLVVDVYDSTTGTLDQIMHQRIRFAAYNAYPEGTVDTHGVIMSPTHSYTITVTPNGPRGSSCTVEDVLTPPSAPVAMMKIVSVNWLNVAVADDGSHDADGTITAYDWSFGDGGVASGMTASHSYAMGGTYTITLTVTDNDGLTGSASMDVTVKAPIPPVASFDAVVSHLNVAVTSTSTDADGTIVDSAWNFGDGATASGMTASHTYAMPGLYTISLKVTDNDGFSTTATKDIMFVDKPPVANFAFSVVGNTVSVDAGPSSDDYGIVSYAWNWGDGTTGTGKTTSHMYSTPPVIPSVAASSTGRAPPGFPYTIFGYLWMADGVTPVVGADVTVVNLRSGYTVTTVSDAAGYYSVDINTAESGGYVNGDQVKVTAVKGAMTGEAMGVADDTTYPFTWIDVTMSSGPEPHEYTVTLTVTDTIGQTATVSKLVTVYW